jgi:hypothetical protein
MQHFLLLALSVKVYEEILIFDISVYYVALFTPKLVSLYLFVMKSVFCDVESMTDHNGAEHALEH